MTKKILGAVFVMLATSSIPTAKADICHIVTTWSGGVGTPTEIILHSGAIHEYSPGNLVKFGCFN